MNEPTNDGGRKGRREAEEASKQVGRERDKHRYDVINWRADMHKTSKRAGR